MSYVKRQLTYEKITNDSEIRALGLDPIMLPPDAVVVRCIETGLLDRMCYSEEEFNIRYQVEAE